MKLGKIAISTVLLCSVYAFIVSSKDRNFTKEQQTTTTQHIADIPMPEKLSFAGENVPLERVDVFESVERELIVNTYLHSSTLRILKHTERYFPVLEPLLKSEGIPEDFKYLAVIESGLNPLAVSPAGASGIWQFMKQTGKQYRLRIDQYVDQRFDMEKATRAAATFLKEAYQKFGSWTLAAAAYNAGMRRIDDSLEEQKSESYYDLHLNSETGRYIYRILALKEIINRPERYGYKPGRKYEYEAVKSIIVNYGIRNWVEFAENKGITYKTLKRFNPWIKGYELPNPQKNEYRILIPVNKELYN